MLAVSQELTSPQIHPLRGVVTNFFFGSMEFVRWCGAYNNAKFANFLRNFCEISPSHLRNCEKKFPLVVCEIYAQGYLAPLGPSPDIGVAGTSLRTTSLVWGSLLPADRLGSKKSAIYIYAPKHLMPRMFHALSLYTHAHSAHIHARNLITFMQRYLYCAPFGARIGVWC